MSSTKSDGFKVLVNYLSSLGIRLYAGVTGGGVVHYLKYLVPYAPNEKSPSFYSISEYPAGFIPLGHYISTGKTSAAIATTGAATKLLSCGLSDAKLHDIPSVYIFPVTSSLHAEDGALQDSSIYGSNIVQQLVAEFPKDVYFLNNARTFASQLEAASQALQLRKPVIFLLDNEMLSSPMSQLPEIMNQKQLDKKSEITVFINLFKKKTQGKRVILLVGEEGMHEPAIKKLITQICKELHAAVVWSINGGNCIESTNPYGYGYISFGGNDLALEMWESVNQEDVVLCIGVTPDEYTTDLKKISAGDTFFLTNIENAYGQVRGSFQHSAKHWAHQVNAPLKESLQAIVKEAEKQPFSTKECPIAPKSLNTRELKAPQKNYANMVDVYTRLYQWWQPNSLVISDVCLAYKDYHYITQRPKDTITYFSFYRGSAMGGAYGVAVGAKLASPDQRVYLFSGDGCFRLYGGSLSEAQNLGIVLFILDNHTYSIVSQGLPIILPTVESKKFHDTLHTMDYRKIADASGWLSYSVAPDLSNFDQILNEIEKNQNKSILVTIPVDPEQILGQNPRVRNL
ncbi:thiamine pyrophosphate-dependent enzyme [Carnobacterium maltaromaticum]|uniref:thiamine pyrophosphate-dependent enzyme n=1 Tax=Carnobacterium maltaromaticum TaxID=2751 RepID=UPI0039AFCA1D